MVYVSITGLKLKKPWNAPRFWWHAVRSMIQAKAAVGNLSADARTINGVHHTLTVWKDEQSMRAFVRSGAHHGAMRAFHAIATGKTTGFNTENVPEWSEVHDLWLKQGQEVFVRKA
jgi:hypothetical protein